MRHRRAATENRPSLATVSPVPSSRRRERNLTSLMFRALEDPRRVSLRWWLAYVLGMGAVGGAYWEALHVSHRQTFNYALVETASSFATGLVFGLIALIAFNQFRSAAGAGYAVLGITFGVVSGIWGFLPLFLPNGLGYTMPPSSTFGTANAAEALAFVGEAVLLVGCAISAVILARVRVLGEHRRVRARLGVAVAFLLFVLLMLWGAFNAPGFPQMLVLPVAYATSATTESTVLVGIGAVALLTVAWSARTGSALSRWLLSVVLVRVMFDASLWRSPRYSLDWLLTRSFGLVSTIVLLSVLLNEITRLGAATRAEADHDPLTGALTRTAFMRGLSVHLLGSETDRRTSGVIFVDIDQFRLVNDSIGDAAGDAFLVECVKRLRPFSPGGEMVARVGGDEFALLTHAADANRLLLRSLEIASVLGRPFDVDEVQVSGAASVGCVLLEAVDGAEEALRRALVAVRAAKDAGGETARAYSPELDVATSSDLAWRKRLAAALRKEQFDNDYQPIIDTRTGQVVGVEALVRLVDDGTRVSAGRFIEHAEASGQIVGIGRVSLQRLLADLPRLIGADPTHRLRVNFNLSVLQLRDPMLVRLLLQPLFSQHRSNLVIEVTESHELSGSSAAHENLMKLIASGYGVGIDDFGAGYSNFTVLEEMGKELIKLDRDLIVRAGRGESGSRSVMAAAVAVAATLSSTVLAEGIETDGEAEVVESLGIHIVQGYRYAMPMQLNEVVKMIARSYQVSVN